jgi:hypothetical protein
MSLHEIATEFCGCWEHGPAVGLFVRISAPNGELAVREAQGDRYRVDWLPAVGGCESATLSYSQTRHHLQQTSGKVRRKTKPISGYEHAVLRLPTSRELLESLLARLGLSLFGDCLMTADGWLFCEVTNLTETFTVLWELARIPHRLPSVDVVQRLREANPGG